MPNTIAYAALLAWPVVTLILMLAMPARLAVMWSLVGGYLLLPVEAASFDYKGVPALDKNSIPNLAAFVLAFLLAGRGGFRWPRSMTVNVLMVCFILSPFLTSLGNTDPIALGAAYLPAMDLYTAFSLSAANAITLLPFILGAAMLRDEASHRELLLVFALAALAYSLPVLAEIRLSPFIGGKLYGVGTVEYFLQQMRGGGFRAMVFVGHGLLVSTFLGLSVVAAAGLWRAGRRVWFLPAGLCAAYLFVVLLLNKSVGPTILTIMMVGLLTLLKPRRFFTVAFVIAAMVMTYPFLRANQLIPVEKITSLASSVSEDRAESADFRFRNEQLLLDRANARPLLGWGTFGRNRVFSFDGGDRTSDVAVTDGTWIIALGQYGWFGYFSLFGLLCYPLWHMFRVRRRISSPISAALAAMLLFSLLDLVPNSSLRPITWLIVGALSSLAVAPRPVQRRLAPQALEPREPQPAAA
ncbi:MAG: hypothetical protein J7494_01400 [Sphingobium sp.]|nr:hypothetical protein [Sphingobium sp.]